MDSRTTSTSRTRQSGATLVELQIAVALGSVIIIAIMAMILYTARSFAALTNYVDLDNFSRNALDIMTREIRQADELTTGAATSMTLRFRNPTNSAATWTVTYAYNSSGRTLVRSQAGVPDTILLEECDFLRFVYFQRNPTPGTGDPFLTATPPLVNARECKGVQLRWICSRTILQQAVNTESVQSARVVLREK